MLSSHPAWYKRYPFGFSVIHLTAIILQHAEDITVAAQQVCDMEEAERQREVLRFEETLGSNDYADDSMVQDDDSVASDASFSYKLNSGAARVFRTPCLRPKQQITIQQLIMDPESAGKLIVVDCTGGGKSLITFISAVDVAGISLLITPLLPHRQSTVPH